MMALNFQAAKHKKMLMERTKNCTVRLGDVSAEFPENSIVWITPQGFHVAGISASRSCRMLESRPDFSRTKTPAWIPFCCSRL